MKLSREVGPKRLGAAAATVVAAIAVAIFSGGNAPKSTFGVDFGWGGPSVVAMHQAGAKFGASYLSYDSSKNWQPAQIRAYHAAGIATVNVWETGATRATAGFSAGQADARAAVSQAAALGEPSNRPIFYAIDCDCSGGQVASYFDGVNSVEGVARTGDYGGYYPTKYLFDTGRIRYAWQTYAWSGGHLDSRAQLYQYSNGHLVGGRDTDYDRGLKVDYGQWPYAGAKPPPPPDPYAIFIKYQFRLRHGVKASEYWTVKTWDRARCRNPVQRATCRSSHLHLRYLRDRLWQVSAAHGIATFGVYTPSSWQLYHRGRRFHEIQARLNKRG